MRVTYLTCQLCGRELKMRKDKRFPTHRVARENIPAHLPLNECMGSRAFPNRDPRLPS
jgi:hypothetical protein